MDQRLYIKAKIRITIVNSLAPGGFDYSLKLVNFELLSMINILSIFCKIAIRLMPKHITDHKSTLVRVMAWCRQATSYYLSQCWPRPQWVNPFDAESRIFPNNYINNMATDILAPSVAMPSMVKYWLPLPCLSWGRISTAWEISFFRNDSQFTYTFMFSKINSTWWGLICIYCIMSLNKNDSVCLRPKELI